MKLPFPHNDEQKAKYKEIEKQVSHHMSPSVNVLVIINVIFLALSGYMIYQLLSLNFSARIIIILVLSIIITFLTYYKMIKEMSKSIRIDNVHNHHGESHKKGGKR